MLKEKFEDIKLVTRRTDNTMVKRKNTAMIYKILHRKLKIEQQEVH